MLCHIYLPPTPGCCALASHAASDRNGASLRGTSDPCDRHACHITYHASWVCVVTAILPLITLILELELVLLCWKIFPGHGLLDMDFEIAHERDFEPTDNIQHLKFLMSKLEELVVPFIYSMWNQIKDHFIQIALALDRIWSLLKGTMLSIIIPQP